LMQPVTPAASGHEASGVFIDDDHLVVLNDILDVPLVEAEGLQQLCDGVNLLRLRLEFLLGLLLQFKPLSGVGLRPCVDEDAIARSLS
jgi:hypothetical protein